MNKKEKTKSRLKNEEWISDISYSYHSDTFSMPTPLSAFLKQNYSGRNALKKLSAELGIPLTGLREAYHGKKISGKYLFEYYKLAKMHDIDFETLIFGISKNKELAKGKVIMNSILYEDSSVELHIQITKITKEREDEN